MARAFDAFIFDLDGTLLDTLPDLVDLTNAVLASYGFPPRTTDEIHSFVGNGVEALIRLSVPANTDESLIPQILTEWKQRFLQSDNHLTHPYPHMPLLLKELRALGCKLGVVSNKFQEGVEIVIEQRLPGYFDVLHGEAEGYPRKPDPTSLLKTIDELGVSPDRVIYIGDSPNDVRTAHNAGVFGVGVIWGYHPAEDFGVAGLSPDLLVSDPLELLSLAENE